MRPRIKSVLVASVDKTGKCFFNKAINLPKKEQRKMPHIKCFGKLVPISVTQALSLVATTEIYML